ncbi:sensor histidine kinase [Methylosarcina fibrata]|uniref:sensor histidine kinase n=1 Tax=Methylosarcina fibrata TaxID=105972 RepID=UPI000368C130|nr:HAMP domain-containing sensor histidine kinase [Methylosarcina fibrata]
MSESSSVTVHPCPFSKGYAIPAEQAWILLKVFLVYRSLLACLFLVLFYGRIGPSLLGSYDRELYIHSSQVYFVVTVLSGICIFLRLTGYASQAQILIFTDIVILTVIMHACGGISSGMGILLAVSIAAGGLMIGGRCAMLFASLGSLAILTEHVYSDYAGILQTTSYTYTGMMGGAYLAIALVSHAFAKRSEQILQLADQQKQTITNLEELNQYIIHHLQSGIIITNQEESIQMANEASLRLVNLPAAPRRLGEISIPLSSAFRNWLKNPDQDQVLLQFYGQAEIQIRFMSLPARKEHYYMLILEDILLYNQRLQQNKLASLGRLTASIAHEIRNPLGAISHAGQLLSENAGISREDQRLVEIIRTNSNRMNQIIEDILMLSRRSASRREKIQLADWLDHYLKNFHLEHGVNIKVFRLDIPNNDLNACIDAGHLKQIMDNLCQNALKYGKPEEGPIRLCCYKSRHMSCIDVIDNGPAIRHDHVRHLFEPFFTTSATGTGLGLYISRELAELNQAKLSYYLTKNNRNCFRLLLTEAEQTIIEI